MAQMVVGYKLIDTATNAEVKMWGGTWGQCPAMPNPVMTPNGLHIHGPSLDTDYSGYKLVEWMMDEPAPTVPVSITPRQCRLILMQQGLLSQVEAMIATQDEATKITWAYATEFRRNDPLLNQLAANLTPPLTSEQIDQFFIAAAQL
jgi:hypothetical protein